jgi:hypothetical protein
MQRLTSYRWLAVGVLFASTAGSAQMSQSQLPQATVRELPTIQGDAVGDFVLLPSRVVRNSVDVAPARG